MNQEKLADYNLWANDRVRKLLSNLTDEEFSRNVLPPYNSIRILVMHIVSAVKYNLVNHIDGGKVEGKDLWETLSGMTLKELLSQWSEMDLRLIQFSVTHFDIDAVFENFLGEGTIKVGHDDYLYQYLTHTVHHRAQIMSALRLMGKEAVGTDYLFYLSNLANRQK
jgi:uncharacterized damage-inducible protein DinB